MGSFPCLPAPQGNAGWGSLYISLSDCSMGFFGKKLLTLKPMWKGALAWGGLDLEKKKMSLEANKRVAGLTVSPCKKGKRFPLFQAYFTGAHTSRQ